ncbi:MULTISPECIES: NAD(P)-dependent oxidoreductase [Enterococcus]|uniref:NAD-dependent epimerase/dehydratase family protein n=1 Tax=Enterococcus TaxID=1350 RepID=UPI000BF974F3|nr:MULTISPECIES: NAD(P)-dependent oxidoreductase [Enterococcus]EME3500770.1 NAD(P)-dependent oxidoreductase [Enterococcus faecium]EME5452493.1 NAD(P)-dependent oxidoreductase [Enterococcus faecium]PEQ19851.1 nucleoside-diphosphate sugar epimerase [Enterococcus faecium]HBE7966204.1 NAD(P)-dependent oxidoreductase [Enterococcus faecium]
MYLVIGGTSFIGVYVVDELLAQNKKVMVTGRNQKFKNYYESKGVQFINLDITNRNDFVTIPEIEIEGIILLAGLLPANSTADLNETENASEYIEINTIGTANVIEFARLRGIKRVISTTSYADVFNSWKENIAITEDEPRGFLLEGDHAAYIISKNAATDLMLYYNKQHKMKNVIFRLPPVYGVGPHGSLLINGKMKKSGLQIFIEKAKNGEDIVIFGNPKLSRDIVYVKDVAKATFMALDSERAEGLYNMTSGRPLSLEKQVKDIIDVFGDRKKSSIKYAPNIGNNTPSYLFSIEKAKKDFDFSPDFANFKKMMMDYKKVEESKVYKNLF